MLFEKKLKVNFDFRKALCCVLSMMTKYWAEVLGPECINVATCFCIPLSSGEVSSPCIRYQLWLQCLQFKLANLGWELLNNY